jgi:hypothetical protein
MPCRDLTILSSHTPARKRSADTHALFFTNKIPHPNGRHWISQGCKGSAIVLVYFSLPPLSLIHVFPKNWVVNFLEELLYGWFFGIYHIVWSSQDNFKDIPYHLISLDISKNTSRNEHLIFNSNYLTFFLIVISFLTNYLHPYNYFTLFAYLATWIWKTIFKMSFHVHNIYFKLNLKFT